MVLREMRFYIADGDIEAKLKYIGGNTCVIEVYQHERLREKYNCLRVYEIIDILKEKVGYKLDTLDEIMITDWYNENVKEYYENGYINTFSTFINNLTNGNL